MVYSPALWKAQARQALKDHWLTGLLIALIVNLPSLLVQGFAAFTGNDLLSRMNDALVSSVSTANGTVDITALNSAVTEIENAQGIWISQALNIAVALVTPCLTLGLINWTLLRLRGGEGEVSAVFSRVKLFFKAILLRLYVGLRIFLFCLPGALLMVLAFLPVFLADSSSDIAMIQALNTASGLCVAAVIVTVILGIIAALRYALSDMVMADHPSMGPVQSAKKSKTLTQGRKGALFALYVSFFFWFFLRMLVSSLALELLGSIPALMVEMLCALALSVYLYTSVSAFYLTCCQTPGPGFDNTAPMFTQSENNPENPEDDSEEEDRQ